MTGPKALVLGCGYVGQALSRTLHEQGIDVTGTSRTRDRFADIEASGATAAFADVMDPASLRPLIEL
ncbi:MAG: NAD-dependent epimerase/dehydratase family protein, partial [Gemmatimonas sp.]|nr:NAD-dependent epimerase/dehydratase family protein [Gemmatimonas sp.]